jgi:CheY-like chemotaxis protein
MPLQLCPACHRANGAQEWRCVACGASLGLADAETEPGAFNPLESTEIPAWPEHAEGAVWLEDLARDKSAPALARAGAVLSLRDLDLLLPPTDTSAAPKKDAEAAEASIARKEMVQSDGAPSASGHEATKQRQALEKLTADAKARARAKAAKRAEVRRAQRGKGAAATDGTAQQATVLVFDSDIEAREPLCALLDIFGFEVHSAATVDEAATLLQMHDFVAAFADVTLDGSDGGAGVELCRRLKTADPGSDALPPALVLVQSNERASDRVLARLAGCDGTLLKPVTRGDVARALESCGVALPADARRG